jgi:ribosomal protein S18 acetylase RimI-like enzyme
MQFLQATYQDKEEILSLYRSLVGTPFCAWTQEYPGEREVQGDLERGDLFCVKDGAGKIIGAIAVDDDPAVDALPCWSSKLQPSEELARLGVQPAYQNQGLARMLLQNGMEELRRRGIKSVHFLVCKTNEKAIRSYAKFDFEIVGECSLFGEEWFCYEKAL